MIRAMVVSLLLARAAFGQEVEIPAPDGVEPDQFFHAEDIAPPEAAHGLQLHGRFDVTWWHFEDSRNVDDFDKNGFNLLSPALSFIWQGNDSFSIRGEIEYEGRSGDLELDTLFARVHSEGSFENEVDLGLFYVPFGIERRYYSPSSNPLIDRPSPFRRVFPGSYSDVGAQWHFEHATTSGAAVEVEAALTRGLHGTGAGDRRSGLLTKHDQPQISGRVGLSPNPELHLGFSYLYTNVERRDGSGHLPLDLVGFDFRYQTESWMLRCEYLEGGFKRRLSEGGDFRRSGWYAEIYHRLPILHGPDLELVARYDSLDENSRERNFRDVDRLAFGLNLVVSESLRIKTEFILSDERREDIANDGFLAQIEYHF